MDLYDRVNLTLLVRWDALEMHGGFVLCIHLGEDIQRDGRPWDEPSWCHRRGQSDCCTT